MAALERREQQGLAVWISPALDTLGFVHAFSTRIGGVSRAPFHSLNLGRAAVDDADDAASVAENLRRFRAATLGGAATVSARQVHGAAVIDASRLAVPPASTARTADGPVDAAAAEAVSSEAACGTAASADATCAEADAVVSAPGQPAALVRTADCAAVLLACPRSGLVSAVHAGWRGVIAGVVEASLARLVQRGADLASIRAAIGPCIGPRAFEVGLEVAEAFSRRGLEVCIRPRAGRRPTIDLAAAVAMVLERAGVGQDRVDRADLCTVEDEHDFFSYRRDGARSGRLAAAIVPGA